MRQSAYLLVSGALKPPDQAPSPTCPFIIKPTMSKNHQTDQTGQPAFPQLASGELSVRISWRPPEVALNSAAPSGEQASKPHSRFGQYMFCTFVNLNPKSTQFRHSRHPNPQRPEAPNQTKHLLNPYINTANPGITPNITTRITKYTRCKTTLNRKESLTLPRDGKKSYDKAGPAAAEGRMGFVIGYRASRV